MIQGPQRRLKKINLFTSMKFVKTHIQNISDLDILKQYIYDKFKPFRHTAAQTFNLKLSHFQPSDSQVQ